jgi:hypothetical protein
MCYVHFVLYLIIRGQFHAVLAVKSGCNNNNNNNNNVFNIFKRNLFQWKHTFFRVHSKSKGLVALQDIEAHGGVVEELHSFLTSILDAGERSASRPSRLNSRR